VDKLFGTRLLGLRLGDKGRPYDGKKSVSGPRLKFLELVQDMQQELDSTEEEETERLYSVRYSEDKDSTQD